MTKKTMRAALGATLKAEEESIKSRFDRAEALLEAKSSAPPPPTPEKVVVTVEKVKRDSFTMPIDEYELINTIKKRCLKMGFNATKSEILRGALQSLNQLSDDALDNLFRDLRKIPTGRPPMK